jgi:hypothetical protein
MPILKALKPGETRTFRMKTGSKVHELNVVAECYDSETPFIRIETEDCVLELTDTEADFLLETIKKALSILPSSK